MISLTDITLAFFLLLDDPLFLMLLLLVGLAGLILLFQFVRSSHTQRTPQSHPPNQLSSIPNRMTIHPRPLMTKPEAAFYNLLCLAVRDSYLIFAKLPVWSVITINAKDHADRRALLKTIRHSLLDFVLVHPGTMTPTKIVRLDQAQEKFHQYEERNRLIHAVFQAAGIESVTVQAQATYTVPHIATLLGLQTDED